MDAVERLHDLRAAKRSASAAPRSPAKSARLSLSEEVVPSQLSHIADLHARRAANLQSHTPALMVQPSASPRQTTALAVPVFRMGSSPVGGTRQSSLLLRQTLLPADSCQNIPRFRFVASTRLVSLPSLETESARRLAAADHRSISRLHEIQRASQRAALLLAKVIPSPALGRLLDADLASVPIPEGLDNVMALIAGKGCGAKYVVDAVSCWESLLRDMEVRGVVHCERARALDVNCFLKNRDGVARSKYNTQLSSAFPDPRSLHSAPQTRTRDGSAAAPSLLNKLKFLAAQLFFDITVDKWKVHVPAPPIAHLPKSVHSAPSPTIEMVRMYQRVAADESLPPAVRSVAFTCALLALAAMRAEQSRMFGVIQIVIMPSGERVVIGKAKKKASGLLLEHFVLPLGGVLKDAGAWWDSGIRILSDLPGGFQGFAARDFVAPFKTRHDPYTATALSNNAMPPHRFDKALRFILQRELLLSPQDAQLYSQHSFRHFLPQVSAAVDPPEIANLNALELLRHAASTLNRSPHFAPADKARAAFVVSATAVSRTYSTNATMTRLIKISTQQMDRVHKVLTTKSHLLSVFNGWELLEP